ncbi:MAG: SOS response-associated peptidase [Deltaproteobacteria bacterium]|nr:SOS response-associated peptidase [Deltaproteobacteria bacterium]
MCGRFTLTVHGIEDVAEALQAELGESLRHAYRPHYNIAPGADHWIVHDETGQRLLVPARWGLINRWCKDPRVGYRQINARAETLAERPAFRQAFAHRRCVVPADGFYEWHGARGAREVFWFHAPDRAVLALAGLYERWTDPKTRQSLLTFTIVTTAANRVVAEVHDRMPALLEPGEIHAWLGGDRARELLRPAAEGRIVATPASGRVGSPANDGPECLVADEPSGQLKLL